MAKNFFKTFFNSHKDKNNISKNSKLKLNPKEKLSDLVSSTKTSDESNILQQKHQILDNMLLNFYSQKDDNNNIINNFLEKIKKLNKKFYTSCEKFISTKTCFDKLSDDLFMNLFQQIDCYAGEIQRLNEKIASIDNKENKNIIKNLTKEISENKEKIRNYELKLKEKTTKEEKLLKEIESYKRRLIFFKNKININLIRNADMRPKTRKLLQESVNINASIDKNFANNDYISRRRLTQRIKGKKSSKFFSPSPQKGSKLNKNESFMSSNFTNNKEKLKIRKLNSSLITNNNSNIISMNNTMSNWNNNIKKDFERKLITVNKDDKYKGIFSDGEAENSNKVLIKIHRRSKFKESIMLPKNYNKDDSCTKLNNFDENNKNIKLDIEENNNEKVKQLVLNNTPEKKSDKLLFEKLNDSNSILSDNENNKDKIKESNNNKKKEILSKSNYSTIDIKNKTKTEKKIKTSTITSSYNSTTIKNKKFKPITNRKMFQSKKILNLPSKKVFKSNLKKNLKKYDNNTTNNNTKTSNNNTTTNNNNTTTNNRNNTTNNRNNTTECIINNTFETVKNDSIENNKDNTEPTKNNNIDNNNNINNNHSSENSNLNNILKSKTVRFSDNVISKDHKLNFTSSESEDNNDNIGSNNNINNNNLDNNNNIDNNEINDFSSKDLSIIFTNKRSNPDKNKCNQIENKTVSNHSGNISDNFSKGTSLTNENLSSGSISLKKDNQLENKKKDNIKNKTQMNFNKKQSINKKPKISNNRNQVKNEQQNKDKEVSKILKEMYDDNSNNIEMLTTQEDQIKFLLNLIDLSDS